MKILSDFCQVFLTKNGITHQIEGGKTFLIIPRKCINYLISVIFTPLVMIIRLNLASLKSNFQQKSQSEEIQMFDAIIVYLIIFLTSLFFPKLRGGGFSPTIFLEFCVNPLWTLDVNDAKSKRASKISLFFFSISLITLFLLQERRS